MQKFTRVLYPDTLLNRDTVPYSSCLSSWLQQEKTHILVQFVPSGRNLVQTIASFQGAYNVLHRLRDSTGYPGYHHGIGILFPTVHVYLPSHSTLVQFVPLGKNLVQTISASFLGAYCSVSVTVPDTRVQCTRTIR
eukprot:2310777-Rhodomonas_salina.3